MASEQSYRITLSNNVTEKEAVRYLLESDSRFLEPDKEGRKVVMQKLGMDSRFSRAFDLILVESHTNRESEFDLSEQDGIVLVEIKSTRKRLENNPYGFFFGATENEFNLASLLGENYKFCFVCLHPETKSYAFRTALELEELIKSKRIQFQINLKNKS
jgi:hypothetical protein